MGIADRTAYLLANPKELEAFVAAAEKNADDWLALNREAHVLAEFAKTAPGRLPSRVQEAIAHVSGVAVPSASDDVQRARLIAAEAQRFDNDTMHLGNKVYVNDLVWALKVLAAHGVPGPDGSVAASDDAQRLDWLERERAEARKKGFQWNTWAYDALQSDLTIRQQIDKARGAHVVAVPDHQTFPPKTPRPPTLKEPHMKMPELPDVEAITNRKPGWDFDVEDLYDYARAYGELVRKEAAKAVWEASAEDFRKFSWVYKAASEAILNDKPTWGNE